MPSASLLGLVLVRATKEKNACATCGLTFPSIFLFLEEIVLRASEGPQLPPRVLAQEVICLDSSSGSEDEKSSRDGKTKPDLS